MIDADIPEIEEINTEPISKDEVRQGIRSLKNGKAGGVDNIVAELLKAGRPGNIQPKATWKNSINMGRRTSPLRMVKRVNHQATQERKPKGLHQLARYNLTHYCEQSPRQDSHERVKQGIDAKLRQEQAGFRL